MKRKIAFTVLAFAALTPVSALAQQLENASATGWAVTFDAFASSDAEDSEVVKLGVGYDWLYGGPDRRMGVRLETAGFSPQGQRTLEEQRVYLRAADKVGDWTWNIMPGTNGDTLLGSASIHNDARFRQEWFIERERVETPLGLSLDLYHTFVGGAVDLPLGERAALTVLAGLQDFTGDNVRTHLRANYVQVIKAEWGLSLQVRTRYFEDSDPGEYDYFSPAQYAEVLPVIQVRRFSGGWRYAVAAGYGAQKTADADWQSARFFNASVTSPPVGKEWAVRAELTYSDTPTATGPSYDYVQAGLTLTRAF